jgi:hypothetical protein
MITVAVLVSRVCREYVEIKTRDRGRRLGVRAFNSIFEVYAFVGMYGIFDRFFPARRGIETVFFISCFLLIS